MKRVTLSVLFAAAAAATLAGAASAQDAPPASSYLTIHTAPAEPAWSGDHTGDPGMAASPRIESAFNALEAKDFARAEEVFAKAVKRNPRDPAVNFYLGATRMDLGKWEDAKKHLEIAARKMPRHPDPKSRLGVTYAKLGDTTAAHGQRAALLKLADVCNGKCRLAPFIANGIEMIDEALAPPPGQG